MAMHDDERPILEIRGLVKRYGERAALETVDLSVQRREFVTLLGPSGSGKTTMLHLIAGLIAPTRGEIRIDGQDATRLPSRERGLGMVFQNYALMPHMSVFENIAFPLRVRRVPRAEIARRVKEVLRLVQLEDFAGRRPRELSGGQQQRVAIARCLVYSPAITLMDEPLGALDKRLREQMQLELKRLHGELGMTVLYVTHDQQEALTMSDRIVLLNVGRIEQVGTPAELYANPRSVFAAEFLGDSNLLTAEVLEVGAESLLRLPDGTVLRARRNGEVAAGQSVKAMLRPEAATLGSDGESTMPNRVTGTVIDSVIMGAAVKHYLRLADGQMLTVEALNRPQTPFPEKGATMTAHWRPADTLVLPLPPLSPSS
jgi:putative spermidine/putrescine transport system ATP-binding protein